MTLDTLADTDFEQLLAIDPETADLLFREARTVHTFADKPVSGEQIAAAYDLMRWGPTAMNTLPLRLLVVRSTAARERLATHMNGGNRDKTLAAPLTIVAAADPGFHQHLDILVPNKPGAKEKFESGGLEFRSPFARTSALIQIGYFIVGLRAADLHVGPMTGFDAAGLDAEFFADSGWQSLVVLNVGYPATEGASHPRQGRLTFAQASAII